MIKNPSYSGRVRIAEERNPGARGTRNPNAVSDVNQKSGPRTGNMNPGAKRGEFLGRKSEAQGLSSMIQNAYAARQEQDYAGSTFPKEGSIEQDVKPRRFKR